MKEGVGWGDAGKRKQGFRGSPSLAQYQASQGWWLEHPRVWGCAWWAFLQLILSASPQWVLHCHFPDEETKAWGDAMRSQSPPAPCTSAHYGPPCGSHA